MDEDPLGARYEARLPDARREGLGIYYTPPAIAAGICEWAIRPRDGPARVLDPAAGSGRFAVAARDRLAETAPTATRRELLEHVVAVDVDRAALDLTASNLTQEDGSLSDRDVRTVAASFFDCSPGTLLGSVGDEAAFDAVVGNPPYLRQEDLSQDRDHYRDHLRTYGPDGEQPYHDGSRKLSTRADAYAYFVTHGLQFLREGGRLGFVLPSKWLDTRYGEDLQEFLYDHATVTAVVGFSARAFDAMVDTVLLFAERCDDPDARADAVTDFVRLNEPVEPGGLADIVGENRTVPEGQPFALDTREAYRVVSVPQRRLAERGGTKLGYYLTAPSPFVGLVDSDGLVRLDTYAEVSFGNKTGNNGFFLLDEGDVAKWDLPDAVLRPAVRSLRDIDTRRLETTDRYLLDLHPYVEAVREGVEAPVDRSELATRVKDALREDGHEAVLDYIRHGEAEGVPEGRTVSRHTPWFNLGELPAPEVLHPVFYDERVFTVENVGGFAPTNAIQRVDVTEYEDVVPHLLNSTLHKVMLELWGRHEGGGALQLLTYELSSVPILDPARLSGAERGAIRRAGERLLDGAAAQHDLDEAVLAPLDVALSVEDLQAAHEAMLRRRIDGAGTVSEQVRHVDALDSAGRAGNEPSGEEAPGTAGDGVGDDVGDG
ncbi:Eco57I restriction-modification methylase domain-containing protein [Haloglomus halophilum]|uniref:Eco57I restriction-modification methylase domain-containing protein n=1 Tax=Haloglomus halophilum TaxID=2962672 RepID=UPI0020C9DC9E|nr:N-6 DNA methylase [Haloglomus halophilum]